MQQEYRNTPLGETKRMNPAYGRHKDIVLNACNQMAQVPSAHKIEQYIDLIINMTEPPFVFTLDDIERLLPLAIKRAMDEGYLKGFVTFRTDRRNPEEHPIGQLLAEERGKRETAAISEQSELQRASLDIAQKVWDKEPPGTAFLESRKERKAKSLKSVEVVERDPTDDEVEKADDMREKFKRQLALLQLQGKA